MITERCSWLVEITCPSRSSLQQYPTTYSWDLCWNTCALSMRATRHAPAHFLKVCPEMLCGTRQLVWKTQVQASPSCPHVWLCVMAIYSKFSQKCFPPLIVIGQRLATMNLLSPLAISDEFSTVRLQHNRAFTELLHAASSSLYPQVVCKTISMSEFFGTISLKWVAILVSFCRDNHVSVSTPTVLQ